MSPTKVEESTRQHQRDSPGQRRIRGESQTMVRVRVIYGQDRPRVRDGKQGGQHRLREELPEHCNNQMKAMQKRTMLFLSVNRDIRFS